MVNLEKRKLARQLIERFLAGEITSDELNDVFPEDRTDPALEAIYSNLWLHYGEAQKGRSGREVKLNSETEELFRRCAAFLGSDLEYEWPTYKWTSAKYVLLRVLGLSRKIDAQFAAFKTQGEFGVWPFFRVSDHLKMRVC